MTCSERSSERSSERWRSPVGLVVGILDRAGVVVGQVVGVGQHRGGAVGLPAVPVPAGRAPLEDTRSGLGEAEVAVRLDLVVPSAQRREVVDAGRSTPGGASVVPLSGVVQLALDRAMTAAWPGARTVTGSDVVDHGLGGPVAGVTHVQDGTAEGVGDDAVPVAAGGQRPGESGGDVSVTLEDGDLVGAQVFPGQGRGPARSLAGRAVQAGHGALIGSVALIGSGALTGADALGAVLAAGLVLRWDDAGCGRPAGQELVEGDGDHDRGAVPALAGQRQVGILALLPGAEASGGQCSVRD